MGYMKLIPEDAERFCHVMDRVWLCREIRNCAMIKDNSQKRYLRYDVNKTF